MTEPNAAAEAALLKIQQHDLTLDFFESVMGLDQVTAELMAKATADDFKFNSVRLTTKDGKSVLDPAVAESYRLKFPNIFAKPADKSGDTGEQAPAVDPALVTAALAGNNLTARGRVFTALGLSDKDPNAIARLDAFLTEQRVKASGGGGTLNTDNRNTAGRFTPPADNVADLKAASGSNPWKVESFNVTRQSQIFRADPALAARLAKAAGSAIGATKNMRTALAPALRRA
jgi:hypothetical protein